jgi:hypothetical protein
MPHRVVGSGLAFNPGRRCALAGLRISGRPASSKAAVAARTPRAIRSAASVANCGPT